MDTAGDTGSCEAETKHGGGKTMPIVQAKCTNCGGTLQVDNTQRAAICPYCNQAYVVEDAINSFVTNIDNLHVENLHVMDDRTARARMEAGEAFLKIPLINIRFRSFPDRKSVV